MLLCEYAGDLEHPPKLQVFGTDLDERAPDKPTCPWANTTVASRGPSATSATDAGTSSTADRLSPPAVASATAVRSAPTASRLIRGNSAVMTDTEITA